ncbi:hypothetical protein FE257_011314 [Aspergillus nanangensis]|uniref:Uncharacterized protein n=1 Tax=Aspergillus nanangensis TaxID=2582783 RepID=A0AAD4GRG9_ASPNN|nr:hypothetical protein FE257_011314 [Aspergillus nanangensis]
MQFSKIFMTLALVMATHAMTLDTRQGPGIGALCTCTTCSMDDADTSCCDGSFTVECCNGDSMTCSCCVGGACGDVGCD